MGRKNLTKNQRKLKKLAKMSEKENLEFISDQEILIILNERIHVPMFISPIVSPNLILEKTNSPIFDYSRIPSSYNVSENICLEP